MERVQRYGDEQALGALLERYRSPLFSFVARRAGDGVAEDLSQETWLRVVRGRASFDPKRRFSTWLFQIANNLCRDRARHHQVEQRYREALPESDLPRSSSSPGVEARIDMRQRLSELPEPQREVLVLRYYHELPEKDIAEIVGVPRGTVKSRLHAAVRALRVQASRSGEAEPQTGAGDE